MSKYFPKRIAIFHNFLDNVGGAEIVALTLAKELNGTIYTTNIDLDKIKIMGFSNIKIKSIGTVPLNAPFRQQLALYRFRKLRLANKFDFYIIAGDWAISGAVNNKPNLEYFHSPLNEIWAFKDEIRNNWLAPWKRPIFDVWVAYNRGLYRKYFNNIERRVCNSENTRARIKRFLNKDSTVINPPIDISLFNFKKFGDYWLSVNRLFRHKRVEIQLKAFSKLPKEKLIIVGSYEKGSRPFEKYIAYLKKIKPKNVKIISWVNQEKLRGLYANCRGFIATAKNEDFGMTPIEAMACGKPVIAANEGGYKESVINNKTGILIDEINENKLAEAIKKITKNPEIYKDNCIKRAKDFDTKIFIEKIKRAMEE